MKRWSALLMFFLSGLAGMAADYEAVKADGERWFSEGSYQRALEAYQRISTNDLPAAEAQWVAFRRADAQWRALSATRAGEAERFQPAQEEMARLAEALGKEQEPPQLYALVREALGDFHWVRREFRNWHEAWGHYQAALDWWAGARDVEAARARYLAIIWKASRPPAAEPHYRYGNYGNMITPDVLENVLRIAQTEDDKARAHYLMAMSLRQNASDWGQHKRVEKEFEAALAFPNKSDWRDDALFQYAQLLSSQGRVIPNEKGDWRQQPDYAQAAALYRSLLAEFQQGETPWFHQARNALEEITGPRISVAAREVFLPGSEIRFEANWRNVERIEFSLSRVDLTRHLNFSNNVAGVEAWASRVHALGAEKVQSWVKEWKEEGRHSPGSDTIRLENKLPAGAYLLEAQAGGKTARDVILITDAAVVVKSSGKQALVYVCDALDGSPLAGARVSLWQHGRNGAARSWRHLEKTTDTNGLAHFERAPLAESMELFIAVAAGERQAFSVEQGYFPFDKNDSWRIYAFTDRPAYRPGETARWKMTARVSRGEGYATPAGRKLDYEIFNPQMTRVKAGELELNSFGSAWDSLGLDASMPLGEYQIVFRVSGRPETIGRAALLRLEEYKLPEFTVVVQMPEENGKRKAWRSGDTVSAKVKAEYYFGGPVANATVEALIRRAPFYQTWREPREFPWFYGDEEGSARRSQMTEDVFKRLTLKTDELGEAVVEFETTPDHEWEYQIEARVIDASRREIVGQGAARVARHTHWVHLTPDHQINRPGEKVSLRARAVDANGQPFAVEGRIRVTRETWKEIWINPQGKEVSREEMDRSQPRLPIFPPRPEPREPGWRLKFRGYESAEVLNTTAKTDASGEAETVFTPDRAGYYRAVWSSIEPEPPSARAETAFWAGSENTTKIGYNSGSIEIIVDKDTFRAGQAAPVMLHAPSSGAHVLFTVEGEDLISYQVARVDGTARFMHLQLTEKHVPNITLSAVMVLNGRVSSATKAVLVPPVRQFLNVKVEAEQEKIEPRQTGIFRVTTADFEGKPVAAEVALSVSDDSVSYIQQDMAGDPRQFFFGQRRVSQVRSDSSFDKGHYVFLDKKAEEEARASAGVEMTERYGFRMGLQGGSAPGFAGRRQMTDLATLSEERLSRAPMAAASLNFFAAKDAMADAPANGPATGEGAVQVRSDFRSAIFWQPDVTTNEKGEATIQVTYPDSLTRWKTVARAATKDSQFGKGEEETTTSQPLIVRLQAPRFFLAGDVFVISAIINNKTDAAAVVRPFLEAEGVAVTGIQHNGEFQKGEHPASVSVPAQGELKLDWVVTAPKPGSAKIKVIARGAKHSDAMERVFPVHEHGIEKLVAVSGKTRSPETTFTLDLPAARKTNTTVFTVQATPSLAVTMLDALPYLIHYPYGCVEQTMSRFLPAVIVAKTLQDAGLSREQAANRVFGGIEPQHAAATHPQGKRGLDELDKITRDGLARLKDFQHGDGGWGWWKEGQSDAFMTAYVAWGLALARQADLPVDAEMHERSLKFLDTALVEAENSPDLQSWMLHALAAHYRAQKLAALPDFQKKAFENLWGKRDELNAYTRALLALSAHYFGYADQAKTLVRNLENGVKMDAAPSASGLVPGSARNQGFVMATAHWGEDGIFWRWSEGGVEATAFALLALMEIDPQHKLVEPVANWLLKNRRGAQWSNTRDTAIALLAFSTYLRQSGELEALGEFEVRVNGMKAASHTITKDNVLSAPSRFEIDPAWLRAGANEITITRKSGSGPIYAGAEARFFSLEEPVAAAGNEIFVKREYFRLEGRPTLLKGHVYDRTPLKENEKISSGDRVEVVLTVEAKNNYEYLLFEDLKPAGFEAAQLQSGRGLTATQVRPAAASGKRSAGFMMERSGSARPVYQELRDRHVAMFLEKLPEGLWEIRYEVRAETPGYFHALPTLGHAMYVPEIRCNGAETQVTVADGASK